MEQWLCAVEIVMEFHFAGALPPPTHPKSPFPRMSLSCGASPWDLALNPHLISGINQLMVEKMVPTICQGSLYVLPPMFSKLKLSFATLSVRKPPPGSFVCKGWDAIGHWLWKAGQPFVFYRSPVYNKSSKGATWLPLSSIYLKVIKKNIKWQ